ncbi:MAG: hypothetical protein WC628_06265 [Candidatus Omnitrophota bacterium]
MKNGMQKKNKEGAKQGLKNLLRSRIKALQAQQGQFARNPAFKDNVRFANLTIIESQITSLQKLLDQI